METLDAPGQTPLQAAGQPSERRYTMGEVLPALEIAKGQAEDIEDPELRALAFKLQQHVADLR